MAPAPERSFEKGKGSARRAHRTDRDGCRLLDSYRRVVSRLGAPAARPCRLPAGRLRACPAGGGSGGGHRPCHGCQDGTSRGARLGRRVRRSATHLRYSRLRVAGTQHRTSTIRPAQVGSLVRRLPSQQGPQWDATPTASRRVGAGGQVTNEEPSCLPVPASTAVPSSVAAPAVCPVVPSTRPHEGLPPHVTTVATGSRYAGSSSTATATPAATAVATPPPWTTCGPWHEEAHASTPRTWPRAVPVATARRATGLPLATVGGNRVRLFKTALPSDHTLGFSQHVRVGGSCRAAPQGVAVANFPGIDALDHALVRNTHAGNSTKKQRVLAGDGRSRQAPQGSLAGGEPIWGMGVGTLAGRFAPDPGVKVSLPVRFFVPSMLETEVYP